MDKQKGKTHHINILKRHLTVILMCRKVFCNSINGKNNKYFLHPKVSNICFLALKKNMGYTLMFVYVVTLLVCLLLVESEAHCKHFFQSFEICFTITI